MSPLGAPWVGSSAAAACCNFLLPRFFSQLPFPLKPPAPQLPDLTESRAAGRSGTSPPAGTVNARRPSRQDAGHRPPHLRVTPAAAERPLTGGTRGPTLAAAPLAGRRRGPARPGRRRRAPDPPSPKRTSVPGEERRAERDNGQSC